MDRISTTMAGIFQVSVDKDHKGRFRGNEEMDKRYRGFHYHVTSQNFTQDQIKALLEQCLQNDGAKLVDPKHLAIGNSERAPATVSCWEKDGHVSVLWTSSFNGALHVTTNKDATFKIGYVTKAKLIEYCNVISRYFTACQAYEQLLDRLQRLGQFYQQCKE